MQAQRYPTPIQRPVNFPPSIGSMQNSGSNSQKHRSNNTANNKTPTRQYYSAQGKLFTLKYNSFWNMLKQQVKKLKRIMFISVECFACGN